MSVAAYKDFEAARNIDAFRRFSGKDWIVSKPRHEVLQSSFKHRIVRGHSDEKARTINVQRNHLALVASEKMAYIVDVVETHRRFARDEQTRETFALLCEQWREETRFESSSTNIVLNENYQKIIGLGPKAVPWIIDDLRNTEDHWFWALRMITRENPVAEVDRGRVPRMVAAWLNWAKENGIE